MGIDHINRPMNTSNIDDIFLSDKAAFNTAGSGTFEVLDETGTDDIWYNTLWHSHNSRGTLFALHEACIETSCRAIDHLRVQQEGTREEPALAVLYRFLNRRFLDRHADAHSGDDDMVNDLFNLSDCSKVYGPRSVLAMTKLEWWGGEYDVSAMVFMLILTNDIQRFYADPINVPDLESFVFDILLASSSSTDTKGHALVATREPQGIERLPTELLDAICDYLPTHSIIKLHRISKLLAIKLPLDNAFWRDSLRAGSLHPHIWGLDTKRIEALREESNITFSAAGWDWRSVAKLLSMKQFPTNGRDSRLDNLPLGLWNRCRIWSIIERALDPEFLGTPKRARSDSGIEFDAKRRSIIARQIEEVET
jgi:hypothetical protein